MMHSLPSYRPTSRVGLEVFPRALHPLALTMKCDHPPHFHALSHTRPPSQCSCPHATALPSAISCLSVLLLFLVSWLFSRVTCTESMIIQKLKDRKREEWRAGEREGSREEGRIIFPSCGTGRSQEGAKEVRSQCSHIYPILGLNIQKTENIRLHLHPGWGMKNKMF